MQNTRSLVKFLLRFKCPKCDFSSYEPKVMQDHLLWCKNDDLVQKERFDLVGDEIKQEMSEFAISFESNVGAQSSKIDFDNFEFEDSKPQIKTEQVDNSKPNSICVKQETSESRSSGREILENLDPKNENVQVPNEVMENPKDPKIDTVLSHKDALDFHENTTTKGTHVSDAALNGNQLDKTNESSASKSNLELVELPHGIIKRHSVCDWENCDKEFLDNSKKVRHYRTHTGEKPYLCDWKDCGKRFASKSYKTKHYRLHTGEFPYACDWPNCGKKFYKRQHKVIHERRHTGETPFVCDWKNCTLKFSTQIQKDVHLRKYHTGEKPYACHWKNCDEKFVSKRDKMRHYRKHEGRYICGWKDCAERFAKKRSLKHHCRVHHKSKRFDARK